MCRILLKEQGKLPPGCGSILAVIFRRSLAKFTMAQRVAAKTTAHFVEALTGGSHHLLRTSPHGSAVFASQQTYGN